MTNGRHEIIFEACLDLYTFKHACRAKKGSHLASNGRAPEPLREGVQSSAYPRTDARLLTIITTVACVMPSLSDEN